MVWFLLQPSEQGWSRLLGPNPAQSSQFKSSCHQTRPNTNTHIIKTIPDNKLDPIPWNLTVAVGQPLTHAINTDAPPDTEKK